ncbi:MAG TPA: YncE family protein [Chitinophagaceae bacterium]|nr:YncE family protein [Chitinophagaceae bacterium]HMZ45820.1 YncE family protein [Chitinophagaceae bacterium]HNJ58392.1 YncE family protein [Chitinophagaceae bacterium]HNL82807.1 YncE family protein [Chitinophagaceae bacterium]HNM33850.1 YncE family protein [Chitinophagaceae bacterium]
MVSFSTLYNNLKPIILIGFICIYSTKTKAKQLEKKDTVAPIVKSKLIFIKAETIKTAAGTKSVVFNTNGTKLYAMNLEGMSISEFDRATRINTRVFKFKGTKALGWDYKKHTTMDSFEEKPVEACFSNNNQILWVSLHNAKGIVPINFSKDSIHHDLNLKKKKIYIQYPDKKRKDSLEVPLIKTGKTPKVIACTSNDSFLLVSNWHSNNVSVVKLNNGVYPYGKVIATIPVQSIPRGIAIDNDNQKTYIAIMGSKLISVIDNKTWLFERNIKVASKPRHIVLDNKKRLFVSYNSLDKIACIDALSGKKLFDIKTKNQPRTIALSKNNKYLFVTCYGGNALEVFKINDTGFIKLYTLESEGKPVGVDIYENENTIEAWVCNYKEGNVKIFTFKKEEILKK